MKKSSTLLESIIWIVAIVPIVYLALVWQQLPEEVPIHFNLHGEADNWGSKWFMAGMVLFVTVGLTLLLKIIPNIDPKEKLATMGSKYHQVRLVMAIFMAAIATFMIYSAKSNDLEHSNFVTLLVGALFIVFGNYFQVIRPNYFIGIRTPWTLESEHVWRKTHRLGGRLWMIGGVVMCLSTFINQPTVRVVVFISTIAIVVLIPVIYSFIEQRKESRLTH